MALLVRRQSPTSEHRALVSTCSSLRCINLPASQDSRSFF